MFEVKGDQTVGKNRQPLVLLVIIIAGHYCIDGHLAWSEGSFGGDRNRLHRKCAECKKTNCNCMFK